MWWQLAWMVVMAVVSYAMRPKTSAPQVKPAGLNEIDFPTAQAGREIPVLFGTRWITGPNVVWYGDLRTTPIREKAGGK
jgi:hypothetical protein